MMKTVGLDGFAQIVSDNLLLLYFYCTNFSEAKENVL